MCIYPRLISRAVLAFFLLGSLTALSQEPELKPDPAVHPTFRVTPASADFKTVANVDTVKDFVLTIENTADARINWRIDSCPAWLQPEFNRGRIAAGGTQTIIVLVIIAELPAGETRGELSFVDADSPFNQTVRITVLNALPAEPDIAEPHITSAQGITSAPKDAPDELTKDGMGGLASTVRTHDFGVRFGYIDPGNGDLKEYAGAPLFGLFYRRRFDLPQLAVELGLNMTLIKADIVRTSSVLVTMHADALYFIIRSPFTFYAAAGIALGVDSYNDSVNKSSGSAAAPLATIGIGATFWSSRIDARAAYSHILLSDNVHRFLSVSAAYLF